MLPSSNLVLPRAIGRPQYLLMLLGQLLAKRHTNNGCLCHLHASYDGLWWWFAWWQGNNEKPPWKRHQSYWWWPAPWSPPVKRAPNVDVSFSVGGSRWRTAEDPSESRLFCSPSNREHECRSSLQIVAKRLQKTYRLAQVLWLCLYTLWYKR